MVTIPSAVLAFQNTGGSGDWTGQLTEWIGVLIAGLLLLLLLLFASSRSIERIMWAINKWGLRRFANREVHDYTRLLRVGRNDVIHVLAVTNQLDCTEEERQAEFRSPRGD
ncbi:hypothetical protein CA13_08430 [Planctomycetes bacterium CA13]|uniref:Uncharacterized protein n=1 Tax=Novipirellula herctigrandis TaxID=2527986 RepID=A0A5C5YWQ4_9BACT|nr:hypothetical protein CA13_08430 [Planctomycetes bacterium CA13]